MNLNFEKAHLSPIIYNTKLSQYTYLISTYDQEWQTDFQKNVVYIDIDYDINSQFDISKGMSYYNKVAFDLIHTKPTKDNKNDAFLK